MKKRIIIIISTLFLIPLINFLDTVGSSFHRAASFGDALLVLINPLYTLWAIISHPFIFFGSIAVFFYAYNNFIGPKKKISNDVGENNIEINNKASIAKEKFRKSFRKIILIITIILILFYAIVFFSVLGDTSGKYDGLGMMLLPFMPLIYIGLLFYPVYFVILALRYSREKSNMHLLDKLMFYILLICIGTIFSVVVLTRLL